MAHIFCLLALLTYLKFILIRILALYYSMDLVLSERKDASSNDEKVKKPRLERSKLGNGMWKEGCGRV